MEHGFSDKCVFLRSCYDDFSCRQWHSWKTGLHPTVVKLQECLALGLITDDHISLVMLDWGLEQSLRTFRNQMSPFPCPEAIIGFFQEVEFRGGRAIVNLCRGPGEHGKIARGKGVNRNAFHWKNRNLPAPSTKTLTDHAFDCTTVPGCCREYLVSFIVIVDDPLRKVPPLVSNGSVRVYAVSVATDGISIKPGLQVDQRYGTVIGLCDGPLDVEYCINNPVIDSHRLKTRVICDVVELHLQSMTSADSLPVGALFKPKSKHGHEFDSDLTQFARTVSTCLSCAQSETNVRDHVFAGDMACVTTPCGLCQEAQGVCPSCAAKGHKFVEVNLRACDRCLKEKTLCKRLAPLLVAADCESYQNTGMELILKRSKETADNSLHALMLGGPEALHMGKRLQNACINYWVVGPGEQRINLYILHVLVHQGSLDVQRAFRRVLPAAATSFRDKMDVASLLQISSPAVQQLLNQQSAIVVTIVPAYNNFWVTNRPGVVQMPTSICTADFGFVAFTDRARGQVLMADNHQPCNVSVMARDLKQPDCITVWRLSCWRIQ